LDLPPYEGVRLSSSQGIWAGRCPAQVPRRGAPPPQRFLRSCWVEDGRGPLGLPGGPKIGQKMFCFAELCGTRSRQQGASKEVHEVGSKRPSLRGATAAIYVRWWIGLICALLGVICTAWPVPPCRRGGLCGNRNVPNSHVLDRALVRLLAHSKTPIFGGSVPGAPSSVWPILPRPKTAQRPWDIVWPLTTTPG
jgi:hypothetical protein